GATQVVRGMPFSLKVTPVSVDDRITVSVNGINKVVDAAIANISIPAVVEDLEINIQVNPKGSNAYTVVNVKEGELDAKIAQCPARLKVIGVMRSEDFDAFRKHAATIVDLDLADVTIKGAGDLANAIPSKAFASTGFVQTALKTIILPTNLVNIEENAFYRCVNLTEITLPSTVAYVGSGAFSTCSNLSKIVSQSTMPPSTGNMTPFPERVVALEVPEGAESYYENAAYWNSLNIAASESFYNIQIDPERSFNYNEYFTLTKIPKQKTTVNVGLPNCTLKPNPILRPNVAFRVYDNNIEVTYYDYVGTSYSSVKYGQHGVVFDPSYAPTSKKYPHDHEIKVVFHYPLNFKLPEGIKAEFVDVNEDNIWREVQMDLFVTGSTARPTLYKEGVDYKFRLVSDAANLEPKVKAISKIMTKVGANPEYKTVESVLLPDENGVYVISDLQGDTDIEVSASLVVEEGSQLSSGELGLVSEEEAKNITNIGVSGELDNAAFTEIRDKFKSLETLNLSELTNEEIPANA
ncbi:MAG: leucine-rich repeat domain-containing protein, partial [Duncaniella dubosii]|nr:leucine-rich repeat domain-containing protein [Duncaniella dubosii]